VQKQEPRSLVEGRFSVSGQRERERESLEICDVGCAAKDNFSNWDWAREYLCNSWNVGRGDKGETTQKLQTLLLHLHFNPLLLCVIKAFCFRERKRL
jgi:hypothetical protein